MELTSLNLMEFIPSSLLILVAVLYVLGVGLKKSKVPDKYITVVLLILGITIAVLLSIINTQYKTMLDAIINGAMQGVLCWGVAIGVNQTAKQLNKEE